MMSYVMNLVRNAWPTVVIVGTIAGAAGTAAWSVGNFLRTEIAASESRLAAGIASTETRLTAQIAASEMRLTAQIAENQAQIAELRAHFLNHLGDHANSR
jgi:hypothetical protein